MKRCRPRWRTWTGVAAGLAAFATTAALALSGIQPAQPARHVLYPPAQGQPGPEGVPIPAARSLGPSRVLRVGELIDGITCQTGEQLAFHIHAHVAIVVHGHPRRVPAGIGLAPPYHVELTPGGRFLAGASCFTWLHTHAADGIVHIESPAERTYTLGEFFDIWGQPLTRRRVGPAHGPVTAFFNGRVFTGNPRRIPLLAQSQIELEVGRPLLAPDEIRFPHAL